MWTSGSTGSSTHGRHHQRRWTSETQLQLLPSDAAAGLGGTCSRDSGRDLSSRCSVGCVSTTPAAHLAHDAVNRAQGTPAGAGALAPAAHTLPSPRQRASHMSLSKLAALLATCALLTLVYTSTLSSLRCPRGKPGLPLELPTSMGVLDRTTPHLTKQTKEHTGHSNRLSGRSRASSITQRLELQQQHVSSDSAFTGTAAASRLLSSTAQPSGPGTRPDSGLDQAGPAGHPQDWRAARAVQITELIRSSRPQQHMLSGRDPPEAQPSTQALTSGMQDPGLAAALDAVQRRVTPLSVGQLPAILRSPLPAADLAIVLGEPSLDTGDQHLEREGHKGQAGLAEQGEQERSSEGSANGAKSAGKSGPVSEAAALDDARAAGLSTSAGPAASEGNAEEALSLGELEVSLRFLFTELLPTTYASLSYSVRPAAHDSDSSAKHKSAAKHTKAKAQASRKELAGQGNLRLPTAANTAQHSTGSSADSGRKVAAGAAAQMGHGQQGPVDRVVRLAELQHPAAAKLLETLRAIWLAHSDETAGISTEPEGGALASRGTSSASVVDEARAMAANSEADAAGVPDGVSGLGSHQDSSHERGGSARLHSLLADLIAGRRTGTSGGESAAEVARGGESDMLVAPYHCSTKQGARLLQQAAEQARMLKSQACVASSSSSKKEALPFVLLRRVALAVMQVVYLQAQAEAGTPGAAACVSAADKATTVLVRSFANALDCSRSSRLATELLHISKCGGTSLCQLAQAGGVHNPWSNLDQNCMVQGFNDNPRWTLRDPAQTFDFWPSVQCPQWLAEPRKTCDERLRLLGPAHVDFYSNELGLHEGDGTPGSAVACSGMETAVVLRWPAERARSHVIEVERVYRSTWRSHPALYEATAAERNLRNWTSWAPAVLDNYITRYLLGPQYLCRAFGSLGKPELLAASLSLASLDHVLLLEEPGLSQVVIRTGLGWTQGLQDKRWRWSVQQDLQQDLGFNPASIQLLPQWNRLDTQLYTWGKTLLKLDVAFHTAAALANGHVQAEPPPAAEVQRSSPSRKAAATAEGRRLDDSRRATWYKGSDGEVPARVQVSDANLTNALAAVGLLKKSTVEKATSIQTLGLKPLKGVKATFGFGYLNLEADSPRTSSASEPIALAQALLPTAMFKSLAGHASVSHPVQQCLLGAVAGRAAVDAALQEQPDTPADLAEARGVAHAGQGGSGGAGMWGSCRLEFKLPLYQSMIKKWKR